MSNAKPHFAPQLYITSGITDLSFYSKGIGAEELYRFTNDDGSVHVAEFEIQGTIFHVHENNRPENGQLLPNSAKGVTCLIGLFVNDVEFYLQRALKHGAQLLMPTTDFDYHYRQAEIKDPYGHVWVFQKRI
ncbi:MAG TPA: VOC family protein [Chryseolinea sp.]|nr:VOC family protein [Chryseolinea sp.]HPM31468.1 VOC family protein [Chryseolinea sp.]